MFLRVFDFGNGDAVMSKIKANGHFAYLCHDAVEIFNEFVSSIEGLKLIPFQPEVNFLASDL